MGVVSFHMAMVRCVCVLLLAVWLVSCVSDAAKKVVKEKVSCVCVRVNVCVCVLLCVQINQ